MRHFVLSYQIDWGSESVVAKYCCVSLLYVFLAPVQNKDLKRANFLRTVLLLQKSSKIIYFLIKYEMPMGLFHE